MVTALVLPAAFPDLHWLGRVLRADRVILDASLPFSRKSTLHRGHIRTPVGRQWIYLPVHPQDRNLPLHQARTDKTNDWVTPLLRSLEFNYRNSIWFDHYEHEFQAVLHQCATAEVYLDAIGILHRSMVRWLELPEHLCDKWEIHSTPPSAITVGLPAANSLDSEIWQEFNGKNYQRLMPGGRTEIPLDGQIIADEAFRYRQHFGEFEPGCCWLDLLFSCGPESWRILDPLQG